MFPENSDAEPTDDARGRERAPRSSRPSALETFRAEQRWRSGFVGPVRGAKACQLVVGLNVLAALLGAFRSGEEFREFGSFGPAYESGEWFRLWTANYVHSSAAHLAWNVLAIFAIGRFIEKQFGIVSFLIVYTVAGLAGSCASLVTSPTVYSVGASGAIFGLFGFALTAPRSELHEEFAARLTQFHRAVAIIVLINLILGWVLPRIDNAAHLGGLAAGVILGAARRYAWPEPHWRATLLPAAAVVLLTAGLTALAFPRGILDIQEKLRATAGIEESVTETLIASQSPQEAAPASTSAAWNTDLEAFTDLRRELLALAERRPRVASHAHLAADYCTVRIAFVQRAAAARTASDPKALRAGLQESARMVAKRINLFPRKAHSELIAQEVVLGLLK